MQKTVTQLIIRSALALILWLSAAIAALANAPETPPPPTNVDPAARANRIAQAAANLSEAQTWLAQQQALDADVKAKNQQQAHAWDELYKNIQYALEDAQFYSSGQDFKQYRSVLKDRIEQSNEQVATQERFIQYWYGDALSLQFKLLEMTLQIRDSDDAKTATEIERILQTRASLQQELESFYAQRQSALARLIAWERTYRDQLLQVRGSFIELLIDQSQYAVNTKEPVALELQTIAAGLRFYLWTHAEPLYQGKQAQTVLTVAKIGDIFKLILFTLLMAALLLKRKVILQWLKNKLLKSARSDKSVKVLLAILSFVKSLYVFLILLSFGYVFASLLVELGFASAARIQPFIQHLLWFFLLLGLFRFAVPYFSLRETRFKKNPKEVEAVEEVFKVLPLLYLYYFLISGFIERFFEAFLYENLAQFYLNILCKIVFLAILWGHILLHLEHWRLINDKATHSKFWAKTTQKSQGRFWEPLVLLLGGGVGVYRVIWAMLLDRVTELEVARSFQAMVSRAILDRQYRRAATKINPAWFPEEYWRAFNYLTPAQEQWYIPRQEAEETLIQAYQQWQEDDKKTRLLVLGDRGVGKSELLSHFLSRNKISAKKSALRTGDTEVERICKRLCSDVLDLDKTLPAARTLEQLMQAEPTVICLENIENAMLRKVGGFSAMAWLIDAIVMTSHQHLWLVTCTNFAWSIARQAVPGASSFTHTIGLTGMSEEQLQEMLLIRHNDATKRKADFTQLNLNESKSRRRSHYDKRDLAERSKDLYFRILWDYTKGNPRQALYYWKASLNWGEFSTSVRLFEVPEQRILENMSDHILMLLAALIEHNGLTAEGLAEVMNVDSATVRRNMEEISAFDVLFASAFDDNTGYHIESFWARAVENYLEKRQFLFRGNRT